MAKPKRKNYGNLLKQLQREYREQHNDSSSADGLEDTSDTSTINTSEAEAVQTTASAEDVTINYDLDSILDSVNDLKELVEMYNYCLAQIDVEQQITQDLLHAIEFSNNYKERYKYSTQLHYNRQRRRVYKDAATVLKPIVDFMDKEENKKCLNKISNLLGECRKIKQRSNDRTYTPRILTELGEIENGKFK